MQMAIDKLADKTKRCVQCGSFFKFSVSDQVWYRQNNWDEPKRCCNCRAIKRKVFETMDPYSGWQTIAPVLYKVEFKGGFDVTGHTVRLKY